MPYRKGFTFRTPLSPLRQQFRDADEVVADQTEQEAGGDSSEAPVFRLAHGAMLLAHPNMHSIILRSPCERL